MLTFVVAEQPCEKVGRAVNKAEDGAIQQEVVRKENLLNFRKKLKG